MNQYSLESIEDETFSMFTCFQNSKMPNDEAATFQYLRWDDKFLKEKPYQVLSGITNRSVELQATNIEFENGAQEELVKDVRGLETRYSLDEHGFSYHNLEHVFQAFHDREKVEQEYIPGVVEPFLKQHVQGADRVVVFDWHVRD